MPALVAKTVRVAATQLESIDFDLEANVAKACKYIAEAADKGCQLIGFSECFIPGYPFWIWYFVFPLYCCLPFLTLSGNVP